MSFDYLNQIPLNDNLGLKQITTIALRQTIDTLYLPKFFDTQQEAQNNYSSVLNIYLANYAYSNLSLTRQGVVLPKGLSTVNDYESWSQILQFLLLFIEKNVSKITQDTTFTYTQNDASDFKFDVNKNLNIEENFGLLKSLDRGQKQLMTKGLSIQDEIKTNQSVFVEYSDEIQTDQNDPNSPVLIDNLKRNNISDYFLNYVNNAVENGNQNKNKDYDGIDLLALLPAASQNIGIISSIVKNQTIPRNL